jgi:hypothetical protein
MASDRYPRATWHPSPHHWAGHSGRRAVVIHIAQGGFSSSIKYMASAGVSSHFITSLQGSVAQMVGANDSAWANGLSWVASRGWVCPHDKVVKPTWDLIDQDYNPNMQTISIEHEGMSGNPWPKVQIAATVELLQWLGKKYPSLTPYRVGSTLIGHSHLDPRDKAMCPGPGIDLRTLASLANAGLGPALPITEPWIGIWGQQGNPLAPGQVGWAIPQLYKFHASELGGCLLPEQYPISGYSYAVFERGLIYYLSKTGRAYLVRFEVGI